MKIAPFGAGGIIGRRIAEEALACGHLITAIARDPAKLDLRHERLAKATGDVLDPASIAGAVAGHDAVFSAIGPSQEGGDPQIGRRRGQGAHRRPAPQRLARLIVFR